MAQLLPVGSIVKLSEESPVSYMIIGYYPGRQEKIWDYSAVLYPGGFDADGEIHMLYADDIKEVLYTGYLDELAKETVTRFPQFMEAVYDLSKDYQKIEEQKKDLKMNLKML